MTAEKANGPVCPSKKLLSFWVVFLFDFILHICINLIVVFLNESIELALD